MSGIHSAAEQSRRFAGYEILSMLGQGGMGIVYEARDQALGRIVALKVLRDDLQARPHLVSRFNREAQAIARLNHPNIIHVYSVGTHRDGVHRRRATQHDYATRTAAKLGSGAGHRQPDC
ncbi:MAG: protein kinase [Candidatus Hydrogenedentes bacterium]|nr:protein kinase [Candidatus Hydrogenedentota bacterium]